LLSLTGLQKLQVRYLFAGVLVAAVGATIANLIIPLLLGRSQFSRYGPLFGMLMVAVIAHAIIRYRLMDIKVVIKKSVVYVCAILASALVFVLASEVLRRIGAYQRDSISIPEALLVALLLAIAFQPLKGLLHTSLNRYLYRETYDYQRTVRNASHHLSTILDLDPLLNYLVDVIEHTFRAESVVVYLRAPSEHAFIRALPKPSSSPDPTSRALSQISTTSPLASLLNARRETVVREEAIQHKDDLLLVAASGALRELGGDIAFPLLEHQSLAGIIILGPKRSGDAYFTDDIALLETLLSQAALALTNAQLYKEVVLVNQYVDNILSTMDSGVIAVNVSGDISLFNAAAAKLTGLSAHTLQNESYRNLPSALATPLRNTIDLQTQTLQVETLIHQTNGTSVPVVCSTATLRRRDGTTLGALVVFSDLTRLKTLEREKRRAERLSSFGALASGIAHEIKNPLVAIRTFAELLPDRYTDADFRDDFSKVVIAEIERIDGLVDRLRGIASTPTHVGAVDIRESIVDTLTLLRAQFEQNNTVVHCDFQDPAPFVAVHHSQLKQLFLNLFLNAAEAMGGHGELRVRITKRELHSNAWIVVEVSDTGPGIPESLRTNIFEPFFTTKPKGSGLGLAICRGIADAHRGTIRAESRSHGPGTTIVVEFPSPSDHLLLAQESAVHN
jgi:PAS domain S-box-containing protein